MSRKRKARRASSSRGKTAHPPASRGARTLAVSKKCLGQVTEITYVRGGLTYRHRFTHHPYWYQAGPNGILIHGRFTIDKKDFIQD